MQQYHNDMAIGFVSALDWYSVWTTKVKYMEQAVSITKREASA